MSERSNEKLIGLLERKFQLIKDTRHEEQNFSAMIDYNEYLSTSEKLTPIILQLIAEGRIAPIYLEQIFNDYLFSHYLKPDVQKVLPLPMFYSADIEARFKLMEKYVKLNGGDFEEWKKSFRLHTDGDIMGINTDREKMYFHAQRLHNDIIDKLSIEEGIVKEVEVQPTISFDLEKAELIVNDKSIVLKKTSDAYFLLKIMFEQNERLYDDWFYSEISEKFDIFAQLPVKKFSNAAYQLKQKIELKTQLTDVFLTTNQSIKLNSKYIFKT